MPEIYRVLQAKYITSTKTLSTQRQWESNELLKRKEKGKYSMSYFNYSSKDLLKSEIETIYSMFIAHVK